MRRAMTVAVVALLVTALGVPTATAGGNRTVTPDMTLPEIQEVLDEGGTVRFAAGTYTQLGSGLNSQRFQLGRFGNDVTIIGAGSDETTIVGGQNVFSAGITGGTINGIPDTEMFADPLPKVNVKIKGIHFADFYGGAILVAASEGLEVSNCRFTRPQLSFGDFAPHPIGVGITVGRGPNPQEVDDVRQNVFGLAPLDLGPDEITGSVRIKNNVFDGQGVSYEPLRDQGGDLVLDADGDPIRPDGVPEDAVFFGGLWYSGMSNGFVHFGYTTADYRVTGNVVRGTLSTGISSIDNGGTWKVIGNTIEASPYPSWYSSGIGLVGVNAPVIKNNEITATGDGIWAYFVDGGVFKGNVVAMRPSDAGMAALRMGFVSNSKVVENEFSGVSEFGVALEFGDNNTFKENEISGPFDYGVFLDHSASNTFRELEIEGAHTGIGLLASSYNSFRDIEIEGVELGIWESDDSTGNTFKDVEIELDDDD